MTLIMVDFSPKYFQGKTQTRLLAFVHSKDFLNFILLVYSFFFFFFFFFCFLGGGVGGGFGAGGGGGGF